MFDKIEKLSQKIENEAKEALSQLKELSTAKLKDKAEDFKTKYLIKKGEVTQIMTLLKDAVAEERPRLGQAINKLKDTATHTYEKLVNAINEKAQSEELTQSIDISLPGQKIKLGSLHPVTLMQNEMVKNNWRKGIKNLLK